MRRAVSLSVPQPCAESWAAMPPTAAGRHCAACAHPVVDFTLKTDAEILAYLVRAAGTRTCGRFAAGQLERPLQRAVPVAPTARWRAWLTAAVALWAVREGSSVTAPAQAPAEWRTRYWGGPAPTAPVAETPETPAATAPPEARKTIAAAAPPPVAQHFVMGAPVAVAATGVRPGAAAVPVELRGVVTDFSSKEQVPGATVYLKGTQIGVSTNANGAFELTVPPALANGPNVTLVVSFVGYLTQQRLLAPGADAAPQNFCLQNDVHMLGEVVVVPRRLPPAPWHPRAFYYWGSYWLTRLFRRG